MLHGAERAHDVALRRLDLDHLGAEIAEDLRRHRPQHHRCQIDDPNARQRTRHDFLISTFGSSFPRKRESRITVSSLALDPRFRGGDDGCSLTRS
jgi:hypothetical protein